MSWNGEKNQIYFQRCQNFARAFQGLVAEANALRQIYTQEVSPGGVNDPAFVDVPSIATAAEVSTLQSYMTDFQSFDAGTGALTQFGRYGWRTPFIV